MPIIIYIEDNTGNTEKLYLSYNWLSPYFRSLFDLDLIFNLNIKEVSSMLVRNIEEILKSNNKLYELDIYGYDGLGNHSMYDTWNWESSTYDNFQNKWIGAEPIYINELTKVFLIELERLNRSLEGKTGKIYKANDYGEKIDSNYLEGCLSTPKTRPKKQKVSKTDYTNLKLVEKWIRNEKEKLSQNKRTRSNSECFES